MRNLFIFLLLLTVSTAYSQFYLKEVAHVNAGADYTGYIICGDTDKDGLNELILNYNNHGSISLQTWEYRPTNRFELVWMAIGGTPPPPGGILTGNFTPYDIGDIDRDGLPDLVGPNKEWVYLGDTAYYYIVSTQESPDSSSLPESLSWYYRYSSNLSGDGRFPFYFTDLDRDNRREIFILSPAPLGIAIFENVGNNQNELVYNTVEGSAYSFAFGDFDLDEKDEFIGAGGGLLGRVFLWENTHPDSYQLVYQDSVHRPNGSDVFSGNDLDGDGKPEFYVCFAQNVGGGIFDFYLYMWEMTGNNTYERTLVATYRASDYWARRSKCGDIDGDGIEEIVWSIGAKVFVYKATSNNQFQRLWEWTHPYVACSQVNIYDMNQNGYNEIVITGWDDTWLFEIEAVRLLNPNGGQNFLPGDSVLIQWQKFTPPRCDSFSLSYTIDNGITYLPILNSIPSSESTYNWIVPNTPSESCRVKVTAYGPGTQFDESDALFTITGPGIDEIASPNRVAMTSIKISPNPAKGKIRFKIWNANQDLTLNIYNLAGELVKSFTLSAVNGQRSTVNEIIWDGRDNEGKRLSAGIYFLCYQLNNKPETKEIIILR